MSAKLLIVVPCYNEEPALERTNDILNNCLKELEDDQLISPESRICYVDDGSKDKTWQVIENIMAENPKVMGVKLSKNFGHQNALLAGLFQYKGIFDCYITIDADLQDDVRAIRSMIEKYHEGCSVVYGVRDNRSIDPVIKQIAASAFYNFMVWLKTPAIFNHADFRLMDKRIIDELSNFKEINVFIRGIIPTIGLKSDTVYYKRLEREQGESKYPIKKLISLAWEGITSFSTAPLRIVLYFGLSCFFVSFVAGIYVLISKFYGSAPRGWSSMVLLIIFFSGANMVAIGLIGEYLGKIYLEVKGRPRYIVEKSSSFKE